jgi:hypothetical protein
VYAFYFAIYGLNFSIRLTSDAYVYNLVSKDPWWWQFLYYGSEGVAGSVAIVLRAMAACYAVYAAFLFWRKKESAIPSIKGKVSTALLLEAGFFIALIPSIIAAFAYYSSNEYLYYFDHTPGLLLLYGTAIPCLAIVLVVPPLLLKLRSTILRNPSTPEVIKWSCLTAIAYLYVVFWFNYFMLWVGVMVPYPHLQVQYGLGFLLEPANLASFTLTVVGLFALATSTLFLTLPALKKQNVSLNLKYIGAVMISFGGYFVFNVVYYYITGGYEVHPSVWYEVIGPLHNPNLWCLAFVFLGAAVSIGSWIRETKSTILERD